MRSTPTQLFILMLAALLVLNAPASAEQDRTSIHGRIEIEDNGVCLKVYVFLTNATDNDLAVVTGAGGVPRSVVPTLFANSTQLVAANWRSFPRRDMEPDLLTLEPGVETLYDAYIVPRPSGEEIDGVISFRAPEKPDHEYSAPSCDRS